MFGKPLVWRASRTGNLTNILVGAVLLQFGCSGDLEGRKQADSISTAQRDQFEKSYKFPRSTSQSSEGPKVDAPVDALWVALEFGDGTELDNTAIQSITIRNYPSSSILQSIDTSDSELIDRSGKMLEVLDLNFDGYNDFRYPLFLTAGPNTPYRHWLYDIEAQKFVNNTELDELASLSLDIENKLIKSIWRSGQAYGEDTYRFVGNALVQINEVIVSYDQNGICQRSEQQHPNGLKQTTDCLSKDF